MQTASLGKIQNTKVPEEAETKEAQQTQSHWSLFDQFLILGSFLIFLSLTQRCLFLIRLLSCMF